jgi:hypothetical protein
LFAILSGAMQPTYFFNQQWNLLEDLDGVGQQGEDTGIPESGRGWARDGFKRFSHVCWNGYLWV